MKEFSIDGHDGAAKTPISLRVKAELESKDLKVALYAPFHIANNRIAAKDIYLYWDNLETAKEAVGLISQVISESRYEAQKSSADIVLYDRHWLTVFTEIDGNDELTNLWGFFVPTFFIECPTKKTMSSERFSFSVPWTASEKTVEYYNHRFKEIALRHPEHIIATYRVENREQSLSPIVSSIVTHILK